MCCFGLQYEIILRLAQRDMNMISKENEQELFQLAYGELTLIFLQGQWRNDFYHGEGSISHASGVTYNGMWYNGQPASK